MDAIITARALHVLAIVIWIGGVAMVAAVILPAIRRGAMGPDWLQAFAAIEQRFIWPARFAVLVAGVTGFYMTAELDLWHRFAIAEFWWMGGMAALWALFALMLFLLEPLILDRLFHRWATANPQAAFAFMQYAHWFLLVLALMVIFGAVAGSHGGLLS